MESRLQGSTRRGIFWKGFPLKNRCFITAVGKYLPGEPVTNDQMEARLGQIGSKPSGLRERVLRQNKIEQRYYAIDDQQRTVITQRPAWRPTPSATLSPTVRWGSRIFACSSRPLRRATCRCRASPAWCMAS